MNSYEAIVGNEHYGITEVRISNFKSIHNSLEPQKIQLAPLTLLCGENSSGKSSLLHSILLITQSISSDKESNETFPLNGNLIKLNEFVNILHHDDSLNNSDFGEYIGALSDSTMDLGINLLSVFPINNLVNTQLKLDTKLSAELDTNDTEEGMAFNGVKPFPINEDTVIELNSISTVDGESNTKLHFSTLPLERSVIVFDENTEGALKQFPNHRWNCKYQSSRKNLKDENKEDSLTFKGVEFNSGIPSKVSKRTKLVDFLAEKAAEQVKFVLKDSEFIRDHLYDWLNNGFLNDGLDAYDKTIIKENEEIREKIISRFVSQYDILDSTEDLEFSIPEESFTLRRNIEPWAMASYRNHYKTNTQLGTDLIKSVIKDGNWEHSELFELILYDVGLDIAVNQLVEILENDLVFDEESEDFDLEEIAENIKVDVFTVFESLIDTKFYIELEQRLYVKFEKIFEDDDETLFYVNEKEDSPEVREANSALNYLRKNIEKIKYIGPLRMLENDEPRIENFEINTPMGLKGEYFFNYYENNKNNIAFPSSDLYFLDNATSDEIQDQEDVSVKDKFNEVLKYFEIAEGFYTKYNHKNDSVVGYIKPIGLNKNIRMTELGVGFSQLAPIILMCITSEPGTTILLEQPELHLHPKVQQKFADFIIEMIEKNKLQIILETHSDHILNRIRRRIAQAKIEKNDSSLFKNCSILFAEREDGVTQFRNANLTNSGTYDLTDFPKGFFDQGAEDAFFILKASMEDENG